MKNFIFFTIILAIVSSCSLNAKKADNNKLKKGVVKSRTVYDNSFYGFDLVYNEQNQISKIVDSSDNSYINCAYNEEGLPIKFEYYFDGVLSNHKDIDWFATDSLYITKYNILGDKVIENYRETYYYNKDKQLAKIVRFKKDSLGTWQKRGSMYEFNWENGNMVKIECYVPVDYSTNDTIITNNEIKHGHFFDLDEISNDIIESGYSLFYESAYTYDNKNNPYNNTSVSMLILPNESNISVNNPVKIEKRYADGEVINFELKYEYNEDNYPTMTYISVTSNIEMLNKVEYTRHFVY